VALQKSRVEVVVPAHFLLDGKDVRVSLGEGAIWDSKRQVLYWIDIVGKKLFIYNPKTNTNEVIVSDEMIGSVVPRKNGGLMLAQRNGFARVELKDNQDRIENENRSTTRIVLASPDRAKVIWLKNPDPRPGNRFNDGKCDPRGRFFCWNDATSRRK